MIFTGDQYSSAEGMKSALERFIASNRVDATSHDLTRLYATSTTTGAIADFRANMVKIVPMRVKIGGKVAPEGHTLYDIFKRGVGYSKMMQRTELALFFWGRNLLWKDRNAFNVPRRLTWINPNLYSLDASMEGLRGFRLSRTSRYEDPLPDDPDIPRGDAVYMHEVDFDDDFDGVSPAERAFLEGSTEPEKAQMLLSTFRNMGIPMGIVQPAEGTGDMKDPERTGLIETLRRVATGSHNAGRTIVSKRRYDWRQMQSLIKDMDLSPIAKEVRESICIGSGVPLTLVQAGASNYAEFEGLRRTWAESWLIPRVEWHAQELTEQLAADPFLRYWMGEEVTIEPDLDAVPFLKEVTATRLNVITAKMQSGIISMYDAQVQSGETPNEAFRNVYIVPGFGAPVPAAEVPNLYKALLPQLGAPAPGAVPPIPDQPSMLPSPPTPDPISPDPAQAAAAAGEKSPGDSADTSFFVGISLANNPDLIALQRQIARLYQDAAVNWNPPDDFHITVVYAPAAADPAQVAAALKTVQAIPLPELRLKIGSLRLFEGVGEHALHFLIRQNADMRAYQQQVYEACRAAGLEISQYSEPPRWIPHITMGYSPAKLNTYTWNSKLVVPCRGVRVCHGEDELWNSTAAPADDGEAVKAHLPDAAHKELRDWRAIIDRQGRDYGFTSSALKMHTADFITISLALGDDVTTIFDEARTLEARSDYAGVARSWVKSEAISAALETLHAHHDDGATDISAALKSFAETENAFYTDVLDLLRSATTEKISLNVFKQRMSYRLRDAGTQALRDGAADAGYTDRRLSPEMVKALTAWTNQQNTYVERLTTEIWDKGIAEGELSIRASLWVNKSLREVYYKGLALYAQGVKKRWKRNPQKDSCKDCIARDGAIKTTTEWEALGLPGSELLECGGWYCGCTLEDVKE